MSRRYLDATEVAKIIRADLKREHPGVKFSVRTEKYSGGASVNVTTPHDWTNDQVRELWLRFQPYGGAGFDGMTDSSYDKGHTLCPEHGLQLVYTGSHWGAEEYRAERCCARAQDVYSGAHYINVQRDWRS